MTAMASSSSPHTGGGQRQQQHSSSGPYQYRSLGGFDRFLQMDMAVERFRR